MRTTEIVGLEQTVNGKERMEWVPTNEVGVEEGGQRLTKIVALISGAEINEVQLTTEQMIASKIYAKTTRASFEDWREINGTRIPLVAKYFLDNASRPYSEFRVATPSDIEFNSPFEEDACYLQFYGLPEPGLQSATPGLSGWWLWGAVVAGISLMLLPIFLVRRSKGRQFRPS